MGQHGAKMGADNWKLRRNRVDTRVDAIHRALMVRFRVRIVGRERTIDIAGCKLRVIELPDKTVAEVSKNGAIIGPPDGFRCFTRMSRYKMFGNIASVIVRGK